MSEYIVFVCRDHYNPLGIVRTLGEAGIKPVVVVVKSDPQLVVKSKYVKRRHVVDSPESGLDIIIELYANKESREKSFILTGDDVTVSLLDHNYDRLKDFFYFYNAGSSGKINHFMNKDVLNDIAIRHGFNVAKTWKVKPSDSEIPSDIIYPVMTKAINSFGNEWKNIVFVCNNETELKEAYHKIKSEYILLQQYIEKSDEYGFEGISVNQGRDVFVSMQTSQVYQLPNTYTPFWYIKNVTDASFVKQVSNMIEDMGLEGIWEFEFIVDKNGKMYFLEINFRNTVIGWATTVAGMPNVTLWCNAIKDGRIDKNPKVV